MVSWLPDFGTALARQIFAPSDLVRLSWDDPTSFYMVGNVELRQGLRSAAGGDAAMTGYIVKHYVLGDFLKHCLVTIPLTWRGLWSGRYVALVGVALAVPVGRALARQGRVLPYLALVAALVFINAFHGFVSVNVNRYNVPNLTLYCFVVAFTVAEGMRRLGWADPTRAHSPQES